MPETLTPHVYDPAERDAREHAIATWDAAARAPMTGPTITAVLQRVQQQLTELPTSLPYVTPDTLPTIPAGSGRIVESGQAPMGYPHITNSWVAEIGNEEIVVYAGRDKEDDTQGLVIVTIKNTSTGDFTGPEIYQTPTKAGGVEVVAAVGEQLTLRAEDNTLFYFDVPTRQWVTPPPSPVPSVAPTPAPSPSPVISPLPSPSPFPSP